MISIVNMVTISEGRSEEDKSMPLNIGSNGWDIDVEAAFDAVLEAAEHMVKTQQIPGVMSTWASGEALV